MLVSPCRMGLILVVELLVGCSCGSRSGTAITSADADHGQIRSDAAATRDLATWVGVYSSPSEIGGFSGSALAIVDGFPPGTLSYRMTFYSDRIMEGAVQEKEKSGSVLIDG